MEKWLNAIRGRKIPNATGDDIDLWEERTVLPHSLADLVRLKIVIFLISAGSSL